MGRRRNQNNCDDFIPLDASNNRRNKRNNNQTRTNNNRNFRNRAVLVDSDVDEEVVKDFMANADDDLPLASVHDALAHLDNLDSEEDGKPTEDDSDDYTDVTSTSSDTGSETMDDDDIVDMNDLFTKDVVVISSDDNRDIINIDDHVDQDMDMDVDNEDEDVPDLHFLKSIRRHHRRIMDDALKQASMSTSSSGTVHQNKSRKERARETKRAWSERKNAPPHAERRVEFHVDLQHIQNLILDFIGDKHMDTMALSPMPKRQRQRVHLFVRHFKLNSKSFGRGPHRCMHLLKTHETSLPTGKDRKVVDALVAQSHQQRQRLQQDGIRVVSSYDEYHAIQNVRKKDRAKRHGKHANDKNDKGKRDRDKGKGKEKASAIQPKSGTVVGGDAKPIEDSNVGHKMLMKLGWKPGESIGQQSSAIVDPIQAVVRAKRRGLGAE